MKTFCIWLTTLVGVLPLQGADSGDQVIVVYNSRLPESKAVAEYYARRRNVPDSQVFGFSLSTSIEMSRSEFRNSLQKPLARLLDQKKLWRIGAEILHTTNLPSARVEWKVRESKIRYAVLCYGVPARITRDETIKEDIEAQMRPELRRNEAAVDTELALLPCLEQNLPLAGPLNNPLFSATNAAAFDPTNGVLMVTRLDGPSPEIARGLVDKAMQADTNGLWGRAYFDLRGIMDPAYKPGDDWLRGGAEICRRLGFETVVDENPWTFPAEFPMSQIAIYCGWYDNSVSGPLARPQVEFMPGAFAYHLHSFSGADLHSTSNYWVGPLLARGATITMGTVDEPYLSGTPQIAIFLARFLYNGLSFGEAAYAAQPVLSWQTTIVGDPLYRPFGIPPEHFKKELETRHSPLIEWYHLRLVDLNLANGRTALAWATTYLEALPLTSRSAVLTEKLGDLYETLGKPDSAITTCRKALQLNPTPQQRVRLRMTLGDRLLAVSPTEETNGVREAVEDYEALLKENPGYPNKLAIYHKLVPLLQKLGKTQDATLYSEMIRQLTPPPATADSK
jgi:uncharacterized protein (TIGR03790 family)